MSPIWRAIAAIIIRNRIPLLVLLGAVTVFMWNVRGNKIAQEMSKAILTDEKAREGYDKFKSIFGDDANVMVASIEGDIFDYDLFTGIHDLSNELEAQEGVEGVISISRLYDIVRDDSVEQFKLVKLVSHRPTSQAEVDSIAQRIKELPFYDGLLLDKTRRTTLLAVSFSEELLNTERKIELVNDARNAFDAFGKRHNLEPRFAGLPILRVNRHVTVKRELFVFLALALIVTAITLLLFFRSWSTVVFPLMVVLSVTIFSLGLIGLFDFEMSLLTGIIPALITVISIPNCIYLITKYHIEFRRTRNKMKSLILVIEKIGIVTIMTNATTATGLGVLAFTDIDALREFGIVAGLSVVAAFFISLLLIPIVFSFLPPPSPSQLRHLDRRGLTFIIKALRRTVSNHRGVVYLITLAIAGLSLWGMSRIVPVAYVVDDVPRESKMMVDLKYIEARFNGVLPFEILIDTKRKNGVARRRTLQKLVQLQEKLTEYEDLSRTLSVADISKFLRQSFFGGPADAYDLPSKDELNFISSYLRETQLFDNAAISKSLSDSLLAVTRISGSVRDIGSLKMEALVDSVSKDVEAIFPPKNYETHVTGTTQVFIKANETLIENLLKSLLIAFLIIALIMGLLFRSLRMVVISLVPNVLPLLMVAGIMGFFGIALKPSTALVFGVAFGIAVDDSIHFLARYRLARKLGDSVRGAVSNSFEDTGVSMIYTSIILFFGFVCFIASDFGGTQALGLLTSMTLGIAMFSNLLFLPAMLITFDKDDKESMAKSAGKKVAMTM